MSKPDSGPARIVTAALVGFVAGAIGVAAIVWNLPNALNSMPAPEPGGQHPPVPPLGVARRDVHSARGAGDAAVLESHPSLLATPPAVAKPPIPPSPATPVLGADSLTELRNRQLALPVHGLSKHELRDSFDQRRGSAQKHEAIDIMSSRNTQVLAVEAGTIARLFESKPGGTTVYQFDPTTRYVYYYAHLERYADGLREGNQVQRGQVLGYVGTSGNAPKDAPHLHFAIFRLTEAKRWWQGTPIDPYEVWR